MLPTILSFLPYRDSHIISMLKALTSPAIKGLTKFFKIQPHFQTFGHRILFCVTFVIQDVYVTSCGTYILKNILNKYYTKVDKYFSLLS